MNETVRVRKLGSSCGITLSRSLLQHLGVSEGAALFIVRTADVICLTSHDPDFAAALNAGRDFMDEHRDAFRKLAG